jgi:hypothetical protein
MAMLDWLNASQAIIVIVAGARHFPVCSGSTQSCRRHESNELAFQIVTRQIHESEVFASVFVKGHEVTVIKQRDKSDRAGSCWRHP